MRTRLIVSLLAAVALALPTAAIADHGGGNSGPRHGGHGHGVRLDTYNLKGRLSAFTAAVGTTPGSITIQVMKGNRLFTHSATCVKRQFGFITWETGSPQP